MPRPDSPVHVLLVEGQDDRHVVRHVCERNGSMPEFGIADKGSVDQVLDAISLEVRVSGRKTVGILVDADDDREARWQAVSNRLRSVDVDPPPSLDANGLIIKGSLRLGRPRVGVWLMPNNRLSGELEDFVADMIPEGDPVWSLSQNYIDRIPEPKFPVGKVRRAEVHAWLATRARPRQMGAAIGARDLDVESAICKMFVVWLRQLFGKET